MTKVIQSMFVGLIVGATCQSMLQAEEAGQPVRFSVGTSAQMTDNRDAVSANQKSNVDLYVRPRLDVVHEAEDFRLDLYYVPAYRYRTEPGDTEDDTTWQHDFGCIASHSVSPRTRLRLNEYFSLQDDPAVEEGGITFRGDQSYIRNVVEAALNYDVMKHSNIDFALLNRIKRYDEKNVASRSDEDETRAKIEHRYQLNETLSTLLTGAYSIFAYDNTRGLDRDFNSVIGAVGLQNAFTPNTLGSLSVGGQSREYSDSGLGSDTMPYVRASLEGLLQSDLRVGAVLGHGVRDADAYPFASQEYTEFRGFANADIGSRTKLRGSATYRLSTYDEGDVPSGATAADFPKATSGDETTIVGDIEVAFQAMEHVAFFAGHRYEDIDSDVGQAYTKNTSRIGASLSF